MSVSGFRINGATQKYNYPDLDNISVQSGHIADGAVITRTIQDGAVRRDKIYEGAVNDAKIASNAVITRTIQDGAVTESKIASNAVTDSKIAPNAVITGTIADGAVKRGKIYEGAVDDTKIASNAVITRTIQDGAVTRGKIASGVIPIYVLNVETTSEEQSSKEIDRSLTITSGELRGLLTGSRLAITFNTDETHSITLYEYSRTYASEAMIDTVELIAFGYSRNDAHVIAKAVAGISINSSDEVAAEITLSWV